VQNIQSIGRGKTVYNIRQGSLPPPLTTPQADSGHQTGGLWWRWVLLSLKLPFRLAAELIF